MIKRLLWSLPSPVHTFIWAITGKTLVAYHDRMGIIVKLEWERRTVQR